MKNHAILRADIKKGTHLSWKCLALHKPLKTHTVNAVEKATHHSIRPEVWGYLNYKTNTALNGGHVSESARNATSSSVQWDTYALT